MILRCTVPRKKDHFTPCGAFVGAVPDNARVIGVIRHSSVASPHNFVMVCRECGSLYEVTQPIGLPQAA